MNLWQKRKFISYHLYPLDLRIIWSGEFCASHLSFTYCTQYRAILGRVIRMSDCTVHEGWDVSQLTELVYCVCFSLLQSSFWPDTSADRFPDCGPQQPSSHRKWKRHYSDVIMSTMASQITIVAIVCSTVCSDTDRRKHQSFASLAFVTGIQRWPVDSLHKGPVKRKMFPLDDVIMKWGNSYLLMN